MSLRARPGPRVKIVAPVGVGGDSEGKGCLSDCPAGHTARYIKRAGLAPTSAPPNGSRRPVVIWPVRTGRVS